jgi:MutS domain V
MALPGARGLWDALRRGWHRRTAARAAPALGGAEVSLARGLADAERASGGVPSGCQWLDSRTQADLDLPLVFRAVDRSSTALGAQVLWRWLVAPALQWDVLAARERQLAQLTDATRRARLRRVLRGDTGADTAALTALLWGEPCALPPLWWFVTAAAVVVAAWVAALWWPAAALLGVLGIGGNAIFDDWLHLRAAQHGRGLELLGGQLAKARRAVASGVLPDELQERVRGLLAPLAPLQKRIGVLALRDPFGLADLLRAGFLLRMIALHRCFSLVQKERQRLRELIFALGEADALQSVAELRVERADARVPALMQEGGRSLHVEALVHPALLGAVGYTLALVAQSLLVTGSNMSGKSTLLRTLAVSAILAQSIHTVFGGWRAGLFRVYAAMRVADDTEAGLSTYAAEVAMMGERVAAVSRGAAVPALFAIDEPFRGTNPSARVPIAVAVLDYLAARDVVVAATHDLEVAADVDAGFVRGYFAEPVEASAPGGERVFDRQLRLGVAPPANALALLMRAGYPEEIVREAKRRSAE